MKIKITRIVLLILIICICGLIFKFSSEVADNSSIRSGNIVTFVSNVIPGIKNMPENEKEYFEKEVLQTVVRKTAHFSIYMTLGTISMCLALTYKGTNYQKGLTSLVFCLLYAISDEIHQMFVPGRSCELRDVMIDTLGALIGILIICLIAKIYGLKHKKEKNISKDTKILFISSTGGHFTELLQLTPLMEKCTYHIVTEKTETNKNLKEKYGNKIDFLVYGTRKQLFKYVFILLANCFKSLAIYLKFRPQVVISTGAHTAGPMCCIAKLLGSKVIHIEVISNRTTKTATGSLLYHFADVFIVQWGEMLELYPKAKYFGGIY